MLKVRVIPTLLWKQLGLVKGVGFDSWRRVGPVLPAIEVYNQREVDELVLVDIMAHQFEDDPDFAAALADEIFLLVEEDASEEAAAEGTATDGPAAPGGPVPAGMAPGQKMMMR